MATAKPAELTDASFTKLCAIIHKTTGITIADGRKSMLTSRLRSRLRDIEITDFEEYIARVKNDPAEMQEMINRVTTNKTYFYRTPRIWKHFTDIAVPEFRASGARRPMRVWSGAASTGEEAHTIGVLLEDLRLTESGFDYSVFGTDVSEAVLKVGNAGVYDSKTLEPFQKELPDLCAKHFQGDDAAGFRVLPQIKTRIKFKRHNLQEPLKNTSPFDAVFLRNVLIYFTNEDQENILRHVANQITRDGFLYIGESESLTRLNTDFEMVDPMVYRLTRGALGSDA